MCSSGRDLCRLSASHECIPCAHQPRTPAWCLGCVRSHVALESAYIYIYIYTHAGIYKTRISQNVLYPYTYIIYIYMHIHTIYICTYVHNRSGSLNAGQKPGSAGWAALGQTCQMCQEFAALSRHLAFSSITPTSTPGITYSIQFIKDIYIYMHVCMHIYIYMYMYIYIYIYRRVLKAEFLYTTCNI